MRLISKTSVCRLLMIVAPLLFFVAALAMMQKKEPFYTWFYAFAWWSYILFVESLLFARGYRSLLFAEPTRYLLLLPLSVTIWLIFEAFNFRLQNWHYLCLPLQRGLRWLGYTIAFATVVPAIFTTRNLLEFFGIFRSTGKVPAVLPRPKSHFVKIGIAMLVLPILFPKIFFPLVWLAFIFLLEPFNCRSGTDSILRDLQKGSGRNLYLLLLSGLLCGILWECWNFWAGSKWGYTIPYLGFLKVFEMPILGFFGFPPFAVECYVMVNFFFLLFNHIKGIQNTTTRIIVWTSAGIFIALFDIMAYLGIDAFTVISFRVIG
jgi:hypothetical protein